MEEFDLKLLQKEMKEKLTEDRYDHTLGVMYTAEALAMCHEISLDRAAVAGILHDCAKCIPNPQKLKLCKKYGVSVSKTEMKNPSLLHAKLGACLAKDLYGVEDEEILSAIQWHTTGKPDMSLLEKIIYLADYIEPGREKAPNLTEVRRLSFADIDEAMYRTLSDTLQYLNTGHGEIDPMTEQTYIFYRNQLGKQEEPYGYEFKGNGEAGLRCTGGQEGEGYQNH